MGQPEGPGSPGFAYDRVIDVWTVNNMYFGYNQYGLWQQGWVSNVRIRNLFGFCHSNLTDKTRWMHNVTRAANVRGYSPVGIVATPFDPAGFVGTGGTQAFPSPGISYTVRGVDVLVTCDWPETTSTNDGGRVELFDADRGLFFGTTTSDSLYPTFLPVGWMISFSNFTTPPRVRVGGS